MAYSVQTWNDGPAGGTPVSAARLTAIENGIAAASLVADQALASVTGNFTGTATDDRLAVLAVPQRFSGIDNTGATDSRAGLQTAISATPSGGLLIIPPGTYKLGGRLNFTQSITVSAYGATFLNDSLQEALLFSGSYETTYTVSATSDTTMTGSAGETLKTVTLTVSGSPAWDTGDIVKVVADNLLPDPQVNAKPGQHMIVVSVSGSTVVLAGRFRDPMTTSIRVARKKRTTFALLGGTTTATPSVMSATANGNSQIRFLSAIRPVVADHVVQNAAGPAYTFDDCFLWHLRNSHVDYAKNGNTVDNTYGYGINDISSEFGVAVGYTATRVRHGYTCNGGSAGTLDAFDNYGRTFGTTIIGGIVNGSTQTGWDTHGNGRRITFVNCQAIDCYGGFNFRGREMSVYGGYVLNAQVQAVGCFATNNGKSFGHFFGGGLVIDGGSGDGISISTNTGGTYSGIKETNPNYIDNVHIRNLAAGKKALVATNSTVHVGRIYTTGTYTATNSDVLPIPTMTV